MKLFRKKAPLDKKVYHFEGEGELKGKRFHLRVDGEDKGVLIIDASRMLILNGTGVLFAYNILKGENDSRIIRNVRKHYRVSRKRALEDLGKFKEEINGLIRGKELISGEMQDLSELYRDQTAPYRMDLALTYRCNNDCGHCYNERGESKELTTDQWKGVLDKLWDRGIPHVVFTGGEPTLREDLPDLIGHAERSGQITGLNTNGRRLGDVNYLNGLLDSGLDHIQITLGSHIDSTHDEITGKKGSYKQTLAGIKNVLNSDIYLVTNTTIMESNRKEVTDTIEFLRELGVEHIAVNSLIRSGKGKDAKGVEVRDLEKILRKGKTSGALNGFEFRWYTPTPYCMLNPTELGLGVKQCTACKLNMAIEPDGGVIPCQSFYKPLGNILSEDFEKIWNKKLCRDIREGRLVPDDCRSCDLFSVCGGGCPLSWKSGDYVCTDVLSS